MHAENRADVDMVDAAARQAMAEIFAAGHRDLVSHSRAIAAAFPQRTAVTHLVRGEEAGATLSFAELDRRARSLGTYFQQRRAQGARALLIFDAGVESVLGFMGCVYGSVISAPLPAPMSSKLDRYLARINNVMRDCAAQFVVTTSAIKRRFMSIADGTQVLENIEWIAVDELPDLAAHWVHEPADETDVVYLQYTSGSTSSPKGVMITHRNVLKMADYSGLGLGYRDAGTSSVCWMPYFHDFGLVDGILVPLAHGMPIYLMSPFDFVQRPLRWLNAISRYRASHSAGPNFALELVARKAAAEELAHLDLSCWRYASIGGEPNRKQSITRFLERFAPHGLAPEAIAPIYGLAETTLMITVGGNGAKYFSIDSKEFERHRAVVVPEGTPGRATHTLVGCGYVFQGAWTMDIRIVDPDTSRLVPEGSVGEVWVSSDLVAKGYWQRESDTQQKFQARIEDLPGVPYLRTGDLGFMLGDELVITGRRKDLIIVEGRNVYPQDLELLAEQSHPSLRPGCSSAFSIETEEHTRVVLVCEIKPGYALAEDPDATDKSLIKVARAEIEHAIRKDIAEEHQVRVHEIVILNPGLLLKTTSGKVERSACKAKYLEEQLFNAVPRRVMA